MKHKKASKGVLIDVALLLLCLLCITTCLSSGIMARYTTKADGAENARLAKFAVTADAKLVDEEKMEYKVTFENESEVAVRYSLKLTFDTASDLAGIVKVKIKDAEYSANGNEILINDLGTLAPNGSSSIAFNLVVEEGAIASDIDFETIVRFEQVD